MDIYYDLENSPLQIKTDSLVGSNDSNERVFVVFYNGPSMVGGVTLYFSSPPQYLLLKCTSETNFPTELPPEDDKVWTVSLNKSEGEIRVTLHCNNTEIFNIVMSDTTCSDSRWSNYWNTAVEKIKFLSDTASDYYRPG